MSLRPLVSVVDDDESLRESLPDLLAQFGYEARAFASAKEFLASGDAELTMCLILDVAMPEMTGLELKEVLASRDPRLPIIFITAHGDASFRSQLVAHGAIDCLLKPFSAEALLQAVHVAMGRLGDGR